MDGSSSSTITASGGGPRFSTVLAARGNDGRPSDLEFLMRSHCQKLRVVGRLLGGAHLLLPKVADTTSSLAIRLYDEPEAQANTTIKQQEIKVFFQSFQMAVVFFILPTPEQRQKQLDDPESLFHYAQRVIRKETMATAAHQASSGLGFPLISLHAAMDKLMARVSLVSSAEVALQTIGSVVEAISKQRTMAVQYFEAQARKHYLPTPGVSNGATIPEVCRPEAAEQIAEALRSWAERFDLPPGEINVLMSTIGSLGAIVTATQEQSSLLLDTTIPVEDRTKRLLRAFFAGTTPSTPKDHGNASHLPLPETTGMDIPMPNHGVVAPPFASASMGMAVLPSESSNAGGNPSHQPIMEGWENNSRMNHHRPHPTADDERPVFFHGGPSLNDPPPPRHYYAPPSAVPHQQPHHQFLGHAVGPPPLQPQASFQSSSAYSVSQQQVRVEPPPQQYPAMHSNNHQRGIFPIMHQQRPRPTINPYRR